MPKGGKARQFITWFIYGVIAGTITGILVGLIWVTVGFIIDLSSGIHYAHNWVINTYYIGAIVFGLGGAAVGAIVGFVIGIAAASDVHS